MKTMPVDAVRIDKLIIEVAENVEALEEMVAMGQAVSQADITHAAVLYCLERMANGEDAIECVQYAFMNGFGFGWVAAVKHLEKKVKRETG